MVYLAGVIGITFAGNIPLNDMLHHFDPVNASPAAIREMRLKYELPWNQLHTIRTVAAVATLVLVLSAISGASGEKNSSKQNN